MVNLDTLKAGDTVVFRDGRTDVAEFVEKLNGEVKRPYKIHHYDRVPETYTKDGYFNSTDCESAMDIVEIIPKENSNIDVANISKGDLVTTRDGNIYEVRSIEPNEDCRSQFMWASHNITLAQYRGGLYSKDGSYQPDCENPMDIVAVQKVKQNAEEKVIRNHVDLHNIAEGDVVYFEDGSESVVDDPATFTDSYVILDLDDFGRFKFNYNGTKFEENENVGNIVHVLHGISEKENPSDNDPVNHPSHYTSGGIECIEAIKASMVKGAYKGYLKGNILKYLWRYEKKANPVEDLEKARTYLDWLIKEVKNVEDK